MPSRSLKSPQYRTLGLECLEPRQLLAATPQLIDVNDTPLNGSPENFTQVGALTFFTATSSAAGKELWVTDSGTTHLVKDIYPNGSSYPESLTNVGGVLFFYAFDGTGGTELWKSDGSGAGTVRVKNIAPGSAGSGPFFGNSKLINVSGVLYLPPTTARRALSCGKAMAPKRERCW
jgi:ELWxxDGT repeat protein